MPINVAEGKSFGKVNEKYDSARPGYPKGLIDDIIAYSGSRSGTALDIGCGTGQATLPLAKIGLDVLGLDISSEMIAVAEKRCRPYHVHFLVGSFEQAEFSRLFNLIVSGMAWHWVTSNDRYERLHDILKKDGAIAFFWSYQEKKDSDFVSDVGKILDKYGMKNRGPAGSLAKESIDSTYDELKHGALFSSVEKKKYHESLEFSKQKYLDLVLTFGWVLQLPGHRRVSLINDLTVMYKKHKEPLIIPYEYEMILAKKN